MVTIYISGGNRRSSHAAAPDAQDAPSRPLGYQLPRRRAISDQGDPAGHRDRRFRSLPVKPRAAAGDLRSIRPPLAPPPSHLPGHPTTPRRRDGTSLSKPPHPAPRRAFFIASTGRAWDDLGARLNRFFHDDPVYSGWFKGAKKTKEHACVVNILSPIKEPFKDNVLFVGDAAWLMELSNPFAILCGWKAANAVTLAVLDGKIDKEGIMSYLQWCDEKFYGPHGQAEFKPIHRHDYIDAASTDYLASLIKEPFPSTMNFYKLFGTIGGAYAELFPTIGEERPDVMAKMMGLANEMDEIELRARKAGFPNR